MPRPPKSLVHLRQRDQADVRGLIQRERGRRIQPPVRQPPGDLAAGAGDVPGERGEQRRELRILRAQQVHRAALEQQRLDIQRRGGRTVRATVTPVASITGPVTGCPAARAAPGSCSHINAGRIDCVIEVSVRSFVLTKCSSSCPNPSASGLASSISRTLL